MKKHFFKTWRLRYSSSNGSVCVFSFSKLTYSAYSASAHYNNKRQSPLIIKDICEYVRLSLWHMLVNELWYIYGSLRRAVKAKLEYCLSQRPLLFHRLQIKEVHDWFCSIFLCVWYATTRTYLKRLRCFFYWKDLGRYINERQTLSFSFMTIMLIFPREFELLFVDTCLVTLQVKNL